LELESPGIVIPDDFVYKVQLESSRDTIFHITFYRLKDIIGDRSLETIVIPDIRTYPWMADSRDI
jgi:hypothetical protein